MYNLEKRHSLVSCDDVVSMYDLFGMECLYKDLSSCFSPDMLDISLIYPHPYNNDLVNCFHEDHRVREIQYNSCNKLFASSLYKPPFDCEIAEQHMYSTFLNVCSVKSQEVLSRQPVIFDMSNVVYGNCGFVSNDSNICIWKSGYYLICISSEIANGFILLKNGVLMNDIMMGTNIIVKITNDNLSQPVSLFTDGLGCNLQIINNTDATVNLPNVSFSLLLINDV